MRLSGQKRISLNSVSQAKLHELEEPDIEPLNQTYFGECSDRPSETFCRTESAEIGYVLLNIDTNLLPFDIASINRWFDSESVDGGSQTCSGHPQRSFGVRKASRNELEAFPSDILAIEQLPCSACQQ